MGPIFFHSLSSELVLKTPDGRMHGPRPQEQALRWVMQRGKQAVQMHQGRMLGRADSGV